MLSFTCSHSLIRRPFLHSSAPGARLPTRPGALHPISRSFRIFESQSRPSNTRWTRISCFRQEEFSSDTPKSEYIEHLVPEEVVKSEFDDSKVVKRDWGVTLREEISCNHYYHFDLENISKAASRFSSFLFWGFISQTADAVSRAIGSRWSVPWSAETILQVMLLWVAAFCFIGSWMVPFAAHVAGFSRESLTNRGQALFSLVTDVTEGLVGITIICRCLSRFRPLPPDWFKFSLKGTWQLDVALGCLMFPLVNRLSQFNLSLLPLLPSTPVTISSVEQAIMARDPVAMAMYAVVVSVCAPMWEEILFRGFLLPSLTKYMPVWSAVLVSSVVFALAHWNVQRILPLIFLGVVMGVVFARSRNLLPSMLLHSLWNGFVFLDLMK